MVECHSYKPTNKLEIVEVVRVDIRCRVDLKGVIVLVRILEKTVHGIQHLKSFKVNENGLNILLKIHLLYHMM